MAKRRKRSTIPGLSWSWKRATGLSAAKARLSRKIGVPFTRSGRQRKAGKAAGCLVPIVALGAAAIAAAGWAL